MPHSLFLRLLVVVSSFMLAFYTFSQLDYQSNSGMRVAIMNYSDHRAVEKLQKLEIGVQPEPSTAKQIERFITRSSGSQINPFLEWEIRVFAEFTHLSSDSIIVVDGFYFQSFQGKMVRPLPKPVNRLGYSNEEYKRLGGYEKKEVNYPFLVRFAPPFSGEWTFRIHIETQKERFSSPEFSFNVVENDEPGYLAIGENHRYLQQGGHTFVPVGCNMPWPQTRKEFDSEFAQLNLIGEDRVVLEEQYRPNYIVPRVYQTYRGIMKELADHGANYFRMIMYPSGTDIEWEELGNYTDRLAMAMELDSILLKAEEEELFIHWDMQIHFSFQESEHAYWTQWTWDREVNGKRFCYSTIPGIEKPIDFFTNETAKNYYKQRIRYILARWGYSPHIGAFELFSEISNVGTRGADNSAFYSEGENWKLSRDWQWEMADYIKSHYHGKIHLLTGSYAGSVHKDDNVYNAPTMDLMSINFYDYANPSFSYEYWSKHVSGQFLNEECSEEGAYTVDCTEGRMKHFPKPLMFSEYGPLNVEGSCRNNHLETNRSMWQSLFSGVATALSWDAWYFRDNYAIFGQMHRFISTFELDKENWHPGATELVARDGGDFWEYNEKWARSMDYYFTPSRLFPWKKRIRKADISYLRSGDQTQVIGVISNKTYNIASTDSCYQWEGIENTPLAVPEVVSCKDERLKVYGLKKGKYSISYYSPDRLDQPIAISAARGKKLTIDYSIGASKESYLVLFVIKKEE